MALIPDTVSPQARKLLHIAFVGAIAAIAYYYFDRYLAKDIFGD